MRMKISFNYSLRQYKEEKTYHWETAEFEKY